MALNRPSLRNQALELLRARILGGDLKSDTIYSATTLASDLGVSPTPIREAMLDLANDGLVEVVPNKGYRLINPTEQDLNEIYELRLLLEVPSLEPAIARATDDELAALDKPVKDCLEAAEVTDLTAFLLSDREFHLGLIATAGNDHLARLVATLRDQTRLFGLKQLAESSQLYESAAEHAQILDAVKDRDLDRAGDLMRVHLRHTRGVWAGLVEDVPSPR